MQPPGSLPFCDFPTVSRLAIILLPLLGGAPGSIEAAESSDPVPPLTSALAIRSLSIGEAERGHPVALEGVVTYVAPFGGFVLQDETDAIWVPNTTPTLNRFKPGDRVAVTGQTNPGGFAPVVQEAKVARLGPGGLPTAQPVTYDDLATTRFDCHRVQISGIVRDIRPVTEGIGAPGHALTVVPSGGMRIFAVLPRNQLDQPGDLIDAEVDLTGVCFHTFSQRRQSFAIKLLLSRRTDLVIVRSPTASSELPFEPIAQLLQFSPRRNTGHSVRLKGIVTHQADANTLFISDETGGIMISLARPQTLVPGMEVEARGFVRRGDYNAVLEDAIVVASSDRSGMKRPAARLLDAKEALNHDAELITVRATFVASKSSDELTQLVLQADGRLFSAQIGQVLPSESLPAAGSEILITGINRVSGGDPRVYQRAWLPGGFELLLASPADITLIREPPINETEFWTRWIAAGSSVLLLLMTLLAARSAVRVRRQHLARAQAEGEFKAVLAERNRLAREIHDTLAQGFTAVFTQLELIRRKLGPSPQEVLPHVEIARDLVRQSLTEARQSIFNLRPKVLEDLDLISALNGIGRHLIADGIRFDCRVSGFTRPIAPDLEADLLRIGQEAMTNAVRHGKPTRIEVLLEFAGNAVSLRIADDGCGFDVEHAKAASPTGGIGLASIQERTGSHAGSVKILSSAKIGTRLTVTIPLPAIDG